MASSGRSLVGTAASSLARMTPSTPCSTTGDLEPHVKTVSPGKRRSGRKPTPESFNENLDEDDLEHLRVPFTHGWKRELVYRNTAADPSSKKLQCDVYYHTPSGRKLRSMVEIASYLDCQKNCPVNLTHFTLKRMSLFKPPHEIVRTAGKTNKKIPMPVVFHNSTETLTKVCISDDKNLETSNVGIKHSAKSTHVTKSVNQVTTTAKDSQTANDRAEGIQILSEALPTADLQMTSPESLKRSRGRPKGSKTVYVTLSSQNMLKRKIQQRSKRASPDWTPETVGYSRTSLKNKNAKMINNHSRTSQSWDDDDDEEDDDEEDEESDSDGELQSVFGTPSKLIASIVRPEPLKRSLDDNGQVAREGSKRMKLVIDTGAHSLNVSSTGSTSALLSNCSTPRPIFVVANSRLFTSTSNNLKVCSRSCHVGGDIEPSHQCKQCGQYYHRECAALESISAEKSLCVNCGKVAMVMFPLSSSQPFKSQRSLLKLVPSPMTAQGLGSLATPIMLSSCAATPSSLSSDLNKPLLVPSSQFLPQVLSPLYLIPGQNTTMPPPPPLASCPRFDAPVTILPIHFMSEVPPPPRLQLCSIPQACQPPPLLLSGSLPTCYQTSSVITLPTLQPCPPLLCSQPTTFQSSITTTSSQLRLVTSIEPTAVPSARQAVTPAVQVNKPGPLSGTAFQTLLVTAGLESSSFETDAVTLKTDVNVKEASIDPVPGGSGDSVPNSVRNLQNIRSRSSSPSYPSDSDDYPPVVFGPIITESCTHSQTQPDNAGKLHVSQTAFCDTGQEIHFQKNSVPMSLLQPAHQLYSTSRTSRMIKDILNRPAVDSAQAQVTSSAASAWVDSSVLPNFHMFSMVPGLNGKAVATVNIGTDSNNQLLTLPLSVGSRLTSINTGLVASAHDYRSSHSAQPLLQFDVSYPQTDFVAVPEKLPATATPLYPEGKPEEPKQTWRNFLNSFRMVQTNFIIMMKIFGYMSIPDLLRTSCVCKVWHSLGMQHCLWRHVGLEGALVSKWEEATRFFNKVGVRSLALKGIIVEASESISPSLSSDVWENIKRSIPLITCLEELFFDQVPASVLDAITEKMPHLLSIGAQSITDSGCISSTPVISMTKTIESMSHAVEAVTSRRMSTNNAARLFRVSEKDLIHLTQTTDKLTNDEETAVLLCCLRLSRMGFSVQKDTVMSKCQEMFARKYLTTSPIPISDSYYKDLYHRNMPLFSPETDVKSSDTLRERLDVHYSSLRRLFGSLWPRTTLSASQVLAFDLKPFNLDKEPGFNSLRSITVTVLSCISACARILPVMTVWPKLVTAAHPDLINVMSKRGTPTFLQVFQYFQKILSLTKERPLVILCHGNASLLSEKLISSCVSDSVYLYCVPPDIAKYVFPGFHGGMLHLLKAQVPNDGLKSEEFAIKLIALMKLKKSNISHSTRLAFTTTGAFPLNARAPVQYQAVDLNVLPHQSSSWKKSSNLSGNQPTSENSELVVVERPRVIRSDTTKSPEEGKGHMTEHGKMQRKNKKPNKVSKYDSSKPGVIVVTTQTVINAKKKERARIKYAKMLAKEVLNQTRIGQDGSHTVPLQKPGASLSATGSDEDNLNSDVSILDVIAAQTQSIATTQPVSDQPAPAETVKECRAETAVGSDVTACSRASKHQKAYSQNEEPQVGVKVHDSNSVRDEVEVSTNLNDKEQNLEDVCGSEANQITSPSDGRSETGSTALIGNDGEASAALGQNWQQSREHCYNTEYIHDQVMDTDDASSTHEADESEGEAESTSILKLNVVSSSDRNDHKGSRKIDIKRRKQLSTGETEEGDTDKESITISPINANKKTKAREHNTTQEVPKTSHVNDPEGITSKVRTDEKASGSRCEHSQHTDRNKVQDTMSENQLKMLVQLSLVDHDYIIRYDGSGRVGCSSKHDDDDDLETELTESCRASVDQVKKTTKPGVTTSVDCVSAADAVFGSTHEDEVLHMIVDEDVTETEVFSESCKTVDKNVRPRDGSIGSSNTNGEYISSGCCSESDTEKGNPSSSNKTRGRNPSQRDTLTEDDSSSGNTDTDTSDKEEASGTVSRHTSDVDEEEDDEDDDDSKCQMCMRSTPPHSKDKIINWIDCDENCGRWFHVICVARTQSKADAKHFICPSCRCKR